MSERQTTFESLIRSGAMQIGDGYRAKNDELGGNGVIFLRAGHVHDQGIDFEGVERFHASLGERVAGKMARPGDAVITTKGNSTGRVVYIREDMPPFVYSPHLSYWRSANRDVLNPRFLYFWSRSSEFQTQLRGMSASTDMAPYLSLGDQRRLRITLPPIGLQRRISETLGSLDDKIELNRRTNETLEAMARAVFRSWFVDFDPVRVKAEGRMPEGMDAATAGLFPNSFEESALGPVPRGWRVVPLPEAIEVNPKRSLPKGTEASYLDMGNMPTTSARATAWEMREGGSGARFANGDVLLARITPCLENGKTAFVDFLPDGQVGWGSTEYIVLHSKPPLPEEYAYFLARSPEVRTFAVQNMTGTSGRQRVPAECFSNFVMVVPPEGLARRFSELAKTTMSMMKAHDGESATIAAMRDGLLPKLLAGQLETSNVEVRL